MTQHITNTILHNDSTEKIGNPKSCKPIGERLGSTHPKKLKKFMFLIHCLSVLIPGKGNTQ